MKPNSEKTYEIVPKNMIIGMSVVIMLIVSVIILAVVTLLSQIDSELVSMPFCKATYSLSKDAKILLLVVLIGGLGSLIHLITSFVKYVGAKKFEKSWIIWYLLRPFIGVGIALIFYIAFRGGFLSASADSNDINVYGVLTIAALSGMFSKQATEKLNEIFSNLFRTEKKEEL